MGLGRRGNVLHLRCVVPSVTVLPSMDAAPLGPLSNAYKPRTCYVARKGSLNSTRRTRAGKDLSISLSSKGPPGFRSLWNHIFTGEGHDNGKGSLLSQTNQSAPIYPPLVSRGAFSLRSAQEWIESLYTQEDPRESGSTLFLI